MPVVATWMRRSDRPLFSAAFAPFPGVELRDARKEPEAVDMDRVDGLLLTGGSDVSEKWLKQPVHDPSIIQEPDPERDAWEFPAVLRAVERGIPVLGVCRGHQVINVALGGTLLLHVPGHNRTEQRDGNIQKLAYEGDVPASRRFAEVNSSHHQALDVLGKGLRIEARCAEDGVVEQVRGEGERFLVGVQYHPERHVLYAPLFADFVRALGN